MNDNKIYIKGRPGFKPSVKEKLGDAWKHNDEDASTDSILIIMTAESQRDALKKAVGKDLISVYELLFLSSPDENNAAEVPELPKELRTKESLRMSVWTSKDSNIKAREPQKPQRDPVVPVF